jgi:hypothetical protein
LRRKNLNGFNSGDKQFGVTSKTDIINALGKINGWKRYLEIGTTTTGNYYKQIDRSQFEVCERLLYNCPQNYADGMDIDFRSENLEISGCLSEIKKLNRRYDVILADPWHEYATSYRDIREAFKLLNVGGALVVHDCFPTNEKLTTPVFREGSWCGVTYKAYLDFVLRSHELTYYTVDVDYGCGVIRKKSLLQSIFAKLRSAAIYISKEEQTQRNLAHLWRMLGDDYRAVFGFFSVHSSALLQLKTAGEFLQAET